MAAGQKLAVSWGMSHQAQAACSWRQARRWFQGPLGCCLSASTSLRLSLPGSPQRCSESWRKKSPFTLCPIPSLCHFPTYAWDLAPPQLLKNLFPNTSASGLAPSTLYPPCCFPGAFLPMRKLRAIVLGSDIAQLLAPCLTRGQFLCFSELRFLNNRTYIIVFCED